MATDREKDILLDALQQGADQRDAFIREQCAGDDSLCARLRELAEAHERAQQFMGAPTADDATRTGTGTTSNDREQPGSTIGPYTLQNIIGEGGFGRVFLARQNSPVERTVALKILKPGMDSESIIARFEAERQALAVIDHPNVSRVFDAGQSPSGRPYFVMEYVPGQPITQYCQRGQLDIRQRLALFEDVCLAVQHAHQKGIIHRDLKPSNVLVTDVDGKPVVKVIDFGIVKAIGDPLTHRTLITVHDQVIGTPAYMSPEQISSSADVDTRSDVYTLGVLLYELLTGTLPFDATRFQSASFATIEQIIRNETPPRPSARVAQPGPESKSIAGARGVTVSVLARSLRGDLDWVVMRTLEKERSRRYPTAIALAEDIRRFLRDEPIEAGPPSGLYRLSKFARRNRVELTAATIVFIALVAGLAASLVFAAQAREQSRRSASLLEKSEAIAAFTGEMLSGVDPGVARGADTELFRAILADAVERIESSPPGNAEAEAELRRLVGTAYFSVAAFDDALAQFRAASDHAHAKLGDNHRLCIEIDESLAQAHLEKNEYEQSETLFRSVIDRAQQALGGNDTLTIKAHFGLGVLYRQQNRWIEARELFTESLDARRRVLGDQHEDTMSARNSLAMVLTELNEMERAREMLEEVVEFQMRELGPDHPHTLSTKNNLSDVYLEVGRKDEGLGLLEEVLETKRSIYEPDHPSLLIGANNLAHVYDSMGRHAEAESMYREALTLARAAFTEKDWRTLGLMNNLASNLGRQKKLDEALSIVRSARPMAEEILPADHRLTVAMLRNEANLLKDARRFADALPLAEDYVQRIDGSRQEHDPDRASGRRLLAEILLALEIHDDARDVALHAQRLVEAGAVREAKEDRIKTARLLAEIYGAMGENDEASRWASVAESSL